MTGSASSGWNLQHRKNIGFLGDMKVTGYSLLMNNS